MTDAYPDGLPDSLQELWRACDATVHNAAFGDDSTQMALFIRRELRLEAKVAVLLAACKDMLKWCNCKDGIVTICLGRGKRERPQHPCRQCASIRAMVAKLEAE